MVTVPVADRLSTEDLAYLAMDSGGVPNQFAAILILDPAPGFDLTRAEHVLAQRIRAIPRLGQRLVRVPPGYGRPAWVADPGFDAGRHIRHVACPPPGDERALLDTATTLATQPIPRSGPLWRAVFVTALAGGRTALVIVVRHVLADGLGGLAMLAGLADGAAAAAPAAQGPPRPRGRWRALRASMGAGGGLRPPPIAACSLVRPTGPRRRIAVVRADLVAVRAAAHAVGASVNDAVLTAVGGALHEVLAGRGETVPEFAIAVPVAGRRRASTAQLGNQVAPLLVTVPGTGDPVDRLRRVSAAVRARRAHVTGPAPIVLLGPLFRILAVLGGYRWYLNHQRRMHTLVSHVRGPEAPISLAGTRVSAIIPVAVAEAGNATVTFDVLSYAGTVTVTAVTDPDHFPDLPVLTRALERELTRLAGSAGSE
jgi:diacylglycerol O-acyltransferase / wax synthase